MHDDVYKRGEEMKSLSYRWALATAAILVLVSACGQAPTPVEEPPATEAAPAESEAGIPVKVAYLATAPLGDFGWYYNGYESLRRACEAISYCEMIGYSENVPEAEGEPYLRDYADKGANLLVA